MDFHVLVNEQYVHERTDQVYHGYPLFWEGQVGLMNISDYGYATSDLTCINSTELYNYNDPKCASNNWLYFGNRSEDNWFLTPFSTKNNIVFIVDYSGRVNFNEGTTYLRRIEPTLYLKQNVLVNPNTDGSKAKPYAISL